MISADDIYFYVRDLLVNSYGEYKIKDFKVHSIKENFDSRFKVEYSVEVYRPMNVNFVPDKGKWISGTMMVDVSDVEVKRDIKINRLLNPDK